MRSIDADALKDFICSDICDDATCNDCAFSALLKLIDNAPTIDTVPVVHGAWIPRDDGCFKNCISQCSSCGKRYYVYPNAYNYCPNCGAKMDLGVQDD